MPSQLPAVLLGVDRMAHDDSVPFHTPNRALLVSYTGAPALFGCFTEDNMEAMRRSGVEVLTDIEAGGITPCASEAWPACVRVTARAALPARLCPAVIYTKQYEEDEMLAATGGHAGFHAGWSVASFMEAFPHFCDMLALQQAAAAAPILVDLGILPPLPPPPSSSSPSLSAT
ncbi:hypothetical protein EON67_04665 [archaeon]|nr:MAG: hypothetical protein EON67_04665 [archaeon]